GLAPGQRPEIDKKYRQPYHGGITPEEVSLYRSNEYVNLLSTERINQLLTRTTYGSAALLRVKNTRFTQPFMNIILLLLGIPCVLTRQPGQLRAAAMKTLLFSGLCM